MQVSYYVTFAADSNVDDLYWYLGQLAQIRYVVMNEDRVTLL